jgi:hypothetical protein
VSELTIFLGQVCANRVVLMDTHFNPTIASQAVHRTYRYGQEKPVYCYQLLANRTMEEKIYSRGVNKTGLSYLVIDERTIERHFNEKELADLMETLCWVQCVKCSKWRCLGDISVATDLPEDWDCAMNPDVDNNSCQDDEKDQLWYERMFSGVAMDQEGEEKKKKKKKKGKQAAEAKSTKVGAVDPLTSQLLDLTMRDSGTCIVAKHYLHDHMLKTTSYSDALERIQEDLVKLHEPSEVPSQTRTNEKPAPTDRITVELSRQLHGASPKTPSLILDEEKSQQTTVVTQPALVAQVPMQRRKSTEERIPKPSKASTLSVENRGSVQNATKDPETSPVPRKPAPKPIEETQKKPSSLLLRKKRKATTEAGRSETFSPIEQEAGESHDSSATQNNNRAEAAAAGKLFDNLETSHVPRKPKARVGEDMQQKSASLLQNVQQQGQKTLMPSHGSAFRKESQRAVASPLKSSPGARATPPRQAKAQQKDSAKRHDKGGSHGPELHGKQQHQQGKAANQPNPPPYVVGQFKKIKSQAAASTSKHPTLPQKPGYVPMPTTSLIKAEAARRPRPAVSPVDLPPAKDGAGTTAITTNGNDGGRQPPKSGKTNPPPEVIDLCDED